MSSFIRTNFVKCQKLKMSTLEQSRIDYHDSSSSSSSSSSGIVTVTASSQIAVYRRRKAFDGRLVKRANTSVQILAPNQQPHKQQNKQKVYTLLAYDKPTCKNLNRVRQSVDTQAAHDHDDHDYNEERRQIRRPSRNSRRQPIKWRWSRLIRASNCCFSKVILPDYRLSTFAILLLTLTAIWITFDAKSVTADFSSSDAYRHHESGNKAKSRLRIYDSYNRIDDTNRQKIGIEKAERERNTAEKFAWESTVHHNEQFGNQNAVWSLKTTEDDNSDFEANLGPSVNGNKSESICYTDKCIEATGYLSNSMNFEVNPCDDFYKFTCSNWIGDHPIPQYVKSWSHFERVFYAIRDGLIEKLTDRQKFLKVTKNRPMFDKLFDFFEGCNNQTQRNGAGYISLYELLVELGGWPMLEDDWDSNEFQWEKSYVRLAKLNQFFLIRIEAMTNPINTSKTIIKIGPPYQMKENIINLFPSQTWTTKGLSLAATFEGRRNDLMENFQTINLENQMSMTSNNDNFSATTNEPYQPSVDPKLHKMYKDVIKELRTGLIGIESDKTFDKFLDQSLENIYLLQSNLEKNAKPVSPLQDYQYTFASHLHNLTQLEAMNGLNLTYIVKQMFPEIEVENQPIFVPDETYLVALGRLMKSTEKSVIANYFATNLAIAISRHTTMKMISILVTDLDSPEVLMNVCYEEVSRYLPELMGKFYLDSIREGSDQITKWKQDTHAVVALLKESFHQMLSQSEWMDESTIMEAMSKLDHMDMNIGFPDWYANDTQFEQYSELFSKIDKEDYLASVVSVCEASQDLTIREMSERLDTRHKGSLTSWPGHRQIIDVNAFYYFTNNGVFIPVAIAQYPFYEQGLPKAITFGSMGFVVAHEITHSIDNTGRLYDYSGALRNWWSNTTADGFKNKTDCFAKQYSRFKINKLNINGEQTLAENIADNGGLREAYRAYKMYQSKNGNENMKRLPGKMSHFNPDQLFFISFANMWCAHTDPIVMEDDIRKSSHSPPSIRVIGSLTNFDQFAIAFNCSAKSQMNPIDKCILW